MALEHSLFFTIPSRKYFDFAVGSTGGDSIVIRVEAERKQLNVVSLNLGFDFISIDVPNDQKSTSITACQEVPIVAEYNTLNPFLVVGGLLEFFSCKDIPNYYSLILTTRGYFLSQWAECDAEHLASMALESSKLVSSFSVPELDCIVCAPRYEEIVEATGCYRPNLLWMPLQELCLSEPLEVPHSDSPISTDRYDLLSNLVKVQADNFIFVA